jgi:hypothetical protein
MVFAITIEADESAHLCRLTRMYRWLTNWFHFDTRIDRIDNGLFRKWKLGKSM